MSPIGHNSLRRRPSLRAHLPIQPSIDLNSGIDRVSSSLNEARVHEGKERAVRVGREWPEEYMPWQMSLSKPKVLAVDDDFLLIFHLTAERF